MKGTKNLVLFVDDEQDILNAIRRATLKENFVALFANSGKAALEIMERREISVLVTDMRMPEMDGLTLIKRVRVLYPKTVRIVLSGYTQLSQVLATVNLGDIFQFIAKPWQMREELLAGVYQGIERFNLEVERDELLDRLEKKNQAYLNIFGKMEEKFAYEKKVLENIEKVHYWTFSYWKKHPRIDMPEYIEFIEGIQQMYLKLLPAAPDEKSGDKIAKDITEACSGRVQISMSRKDKWYFTGYQDFLLLVCRIFVNLIASDPEKAVFLTLEPDNSALEVTGITLGMVQDSLTLSTFSQNRLIIGFSLLNEMSGIFDTKLALKMIDGKISSLQIICRAK